MLEDPDLFDLLEWGHREHDGLMNAIRFCSITVIYETVLKLWKDAGSPSLDEERILR